MTQPDMRGKICIVTGGKCGLGKAESNSHPGFRRELVKKAGLVVHRHQPCPLDIPEVN